MDVKTKIVGDIIVIYLHGRLDIVEAESVEKAIFNIAESSIGKHIVLELQELDYLSSSGLRIFISLKRFLEQYGCQLILCNKSNHAVNLFFKIINIEYMFKIFETAKEAIRHLTNDIKTYADKIA